MEQKILLTPGPLNTSRTVKEAMLYDLGTRDREYQEKNCWIWPMYQKKSTLLFFCRDREHTEWKVFWKDR